MKSLTATEVARNISLILDDLEETGEEVAITRDHRTVARIVREPAEQNALEMFADLGQKPCEATYEGLGGTLPQKNLGKNGTLGELRDPWAS